VTGSFCVGCGAPLTPGAQFCAHCGRPAASASPAPNVAPVASPPLPTFGAAPPAPGPTYAPGPPPPRRRSRLVTIVVIIVVVALVLGAVGLYFASTAPRVDVTEINVYAPDDVCGLKGFAGYYGFNSTPGSSLSLELPFTNANSSSCTIHGVTTNTTGFTLSDVQVPVTVAAEKSSALNLTMALPSGSYTGAVNLVFS
jgi:hypothetical protein